MQGIAKDLGDYDAAGFIDFYSGSHNGIKSTIYDGN